MNNNNKFFYPSDRFEFIHHPEYGCRDLKGLRTLLRIYEKKSNPRNLKNKKFLGCPNFT
jgi:hypothetical protein